MVPERPYDYLHLVEKDPDIETYDAGLRPETPRLEGVCSGFLCDILEESGGTSGGPSNSSVSQEPRGLSEEDEEMEREETLRQALEILESMNEADKDAKLEYHRISDIWVAKVNRLKKDLDEKRAEVRMIERAIKSAKSRVLPPPPGPVCLSWLDSEIYLGVSSVVILCNMVTITKEVVDPELSHYFFPVDCGFLVFYTLELVLRVVYSQRQFFCGNCAEIAWNWLDLVIFVVAIVSLLVPKPAESGGRSNLNATYMSCFRVLRLARLVYYFLRSDLSWIEGSVFQSFIMAIIGLNAILMGVEEETPHLKPMWFWIEQTTLTIFTFEIVVRIKAKGCDFFTCRKDLVWNLLDFVIVTGGVIDLWMLPTYHFLLTMLGHSVPPRKAEINQVMNILRMARLLRILRLVRLIKNIPPLYNLVIGVAKSIQGMGWVIILTVVLLYMCALLGVKLLGPQGLLWNRDSDGNILDLPPGVADAFPDMCGAFFNMFKVMNADMAPVEPLFEYIPSTKFVAMIYVVLTNWAIFSILTAVVSDHMAAVTGDTEKEMEDERKALERQQLVGSIFDRLDNDSSGYVNRRDLEDLLEKEDECNLLIPAGEMTPDDLREFFDILSPKGLEGEETYISKDAFVKGLEKESNEVNLRAIMRIEKRLTYFEQQLMSGITRVGNFVSPCNGARDQAFVRR